ncbi:MAG: heme ABC transporter permease [Litorivicinus sp.]
MSRSWQWFHRWGSSPYVFRVGRRWQIGLGSIGATLLLIGWFWGLAIAPVDYQQGNSYRIIFLHVPVAFLAQSLYMGLAVAGVVLLVWKMKIADVAIQAGLPVGAVITFLALVTGAIWGKPTWGTYWVWDARLTSMLILLFLYLGAMALRPALPSDVAGKAVALLVIVGVINIPIIKYSVEWWNTLHQGETLKLTERPAMPASMWMPLVVSILAFYCLAGYWVLKRLRTLLLVRESKASWAREYVEQHHGL